MSLDVIQLKNKLHPVLKTNEKIGIVYLYGSYASGQQNLASDIDLAIFFTEHDVVKRHDLLFKISSKISGALNTDKIDACSLNDLEGIELRYQIITRGHILFEREPYRLIVEPNILNDYFDFKDLLRKYKLTGT